MRLRKISRKAPQKVSSNLKRVKNASCFHMKNEKTGIISPLWPEIAAELYYLARLVLVNAAANHIAGSDRCLPNRELPNTFQTLALVS